MDLAAAGELGASETLVLGSRHGAGLGSKGEARVNTWAT